MRIQKTITLDTERDGDLLAWLDAQRNTSEAVREALRAAIGPRRADVTLNEVYRAVLDLSAKVATGAVLVQGAATYDGDAPGTEQAAIALDTLGL